MIPNTDPLEEKKAIKRKRQARRLVLQALYQWQMSGADPVEVEAQNLATARTDKLDSRYFHDVFHGVTSDPKTLEAEITPFLDRPITSLNPIELAVLRLSTWEFLHRPEIPYKVLLDEAVSLTREFGSQDGYRYVNGVLNQLARKIRAVEIAADHE